MSLTTEEKQIIKATVPILEAGGETLTKHFYARMMKHNPEVRRFFDQTHQQNGAQAKALANAVLFYAKNIDNLDALGAVAPTIIEKHVALDIHAKEYPIVGSNLIASMTEVLGPDTATPAVIEAWTKAYNQLANILIGAEDKEYSRIEHTAGGWSGFRPFTIKNKVKETHDVTSFYLSPVDGKPVLKSEPGQYLTIKVDGNAPDEQRRNYSISNAPSSSEYRITVKNIGSVSKWLHNQPVGSVVQLRPPLGNFVLDPKDAAGKKIVLIAGGIGITPLAAMALAGVKGTLMYYAHTDSDRALEQELSKLPGLEIVKLSHHRPHKDDIEKFVPKDALVYFTGPVGFMQSLYDHLKERGVPAENVHCEFFGPSRPL